MGRIGQAMWELKQDYIIRTVEKEETLIFWLNSGARYPIIQTRLKRQIDHRRPGETARCAHPVFPSNRDINANAMTPLLRWGSAVSKSRDSLVLGASRWRRHQFV